MRGREDLVRKVGIQLQIWLVLDIPMWYNGKRSLQGYYISILKCSNIIYFPGDFKTMKG